METLADYGTVSYFGVSVFTTGIFKTWFGLGDYSTAAKMAALLLIFIFILIATERYSRKRIKYYNSIGARTKFPEYKLKGFEVFIVLTMYNVKIWRNQHTISYAIKKQSVAGVN